MSSGFFSLSLGSLPAGLPPNPRASIAMAAMINPQNNSRPIPIPPHPIPNPSYPHIISFSVKREAARSPPHGLLASAPAGTTAVSPAISHAVSGTESAETLIRDGFLFRRERRIEVLQGCGVGLHFGLALLHELRLLREQFRCRACAPRFVHLGEPRLPVFIPLFGVLGECLPCRILFGRDSQLRLQRRKTVLRIAGVGIEHALRPHAVARTVSAHVRAAPAHAVSRTVAAHHSRSHAVAGPSAVAAHVPAAPAPAVAEGMPTDCRCRQPERQCCADGECDFRSSFHDLFSE